MNKNIYFKTNINCNNCIKTVAPHLNRLLIIDTWKVDLDSPDKILHVVLDDDGEEAQIMEVVKNAGFKIEVRKEN